MNEINKRENKYKPDDQRNKTQHFGKDFENVKLRSNVEQNVSINNQYKE